nr:hypothetical protein [Tanacetum cinerariifolium]
PRKASASSKSRKSLSPNGVSAVEVVETIRSSEGVGLPLAFKSHEVGVSLGSESPFHTESGMRLMLAPRSANAKHSSIPGNSQGMRNFPGSPSFLGNLFRMTANNARSSRFEPFH